MEIKIDKKCNCCGTIHPIMPKDAKPWNDDGKIIGYYFQCKCASTMFVKAAKCPEKIKAS